MYPESFEYIGEEKFSHTCCINGFGARNDDHPLHKAMVDHNQNGVHPMYFQKVGDEIYRELFKGKGC